jgi:hypothetical protein
VPNGLPIRRIVRELITLQPGCSRPPLPRGKHRPAAISGDGKQPRLEPATAIPIRQGSQSPDKCLLSRILGILPVPEHSIAQAKDGIAIPVDQVEHGLLVAGQAAIDQFDNAIPIRQFVRPVCLTCTRNDQLKFHSGNLSDKSSRENGKCVRPSVPASLRLAFPGRVSLAAFDLCR